MKRMKVRKQVLAALIMTGALVLGGCGGTADEKVQTAGGSQAESSAAVQAEAESSAAAQAGAESSAAAQAGAESSAAAQAEAESTAAAQAGAEPSAAVQAEAESSAAAQTAGPEPETTGADVAVDGLVFTQEGRLGAVTDQEDTRYEQFTDFLNIADTFALAPGYQQNIVTQGMDQSDETGNIYVSGYFKRDEDNPFDKQGNPTAIAVLDAEGRLLGEYVMRGEDGSAFTSHMGGVAVSEDMIYVSGSQRKDEKGKTSYWIAAIPLAKLEAEGHHEVTVETYYRVPVQPSYLNYSGGVLWVGNFYHAEENSYKAPSTLGKTKADNDDQRFGGYLLGYDLTEKGAERMVPGEGQTFAMPDADKLYATIDRIQGMTMLEDGSIVLSRSYGRTANSQLMVYDPAKAVSKKVTLDEVEYDCVMLEESTCQEQFYTALPMSEGITVKTDGNGREILVLFESGSVVFDGDGTYDTKAGVFRTDYIWKMELP